MDDEKPQSWHFDGDTIPDPTQQRVNTTSYTSVANTMARDTKNHALARSVVRSGFFGIFALSIVLAIYLPSIAVAIMLVMVLLHLILAIFSHPKQAHIFFILGYLGLYGLLIILTT